MEKDFIDQLKMIPLSQRQYASMELDREYIHGRMCSFYVQRKPGSLCVDVGDVLVNVVSNYDLSCIYIGELNFDRVAAMDDDYFQVGTFAEGLICVSRHDGSVRVLPDVYKPDSCYNKAYYCSKDSGAFMEALIPAAIFLEWAVYDNRLLDGELTNGIILHCAKIAGKKSLEFFRALIEGPED